MVYPALEAATPPPLVQSFPAPVLVSDASIPSLSSPAPSALQVATPAPSHVEKSVPERSDASALGQPLSIPSDSQQAIRFTVSPFSEFSTASQTLTAQVSSFREFERPTSRATTPVPAILLAQQSSPLPSDAPPVPKLTPDSGPDLAPDPSPSLTPQTPQAPQAPTPQAPTPQAPTPQAPQSSDPQFVPQSVPNSPAAPSASRNSTFVELSADREEYETLERSVTAIGNVLLNYRNAQLKADRVRTLALTKQVFAEGNIRLTLGEQVLQGERLEYELDQEKGVLFKPSGIINLPTTSRDFSDATPGTNATGSNPLNPLNPLNSLQQPRLEARKGLQRLRFEADRIEFTARSWRAINIRITSDPFSPPELEVRADQAQLTRISAKEDSVNLQKPRLVFDQGISIPIPRSTIALSRQRQNPFTVDIGYDDKDRGGLYLGRTFTPISNPKFSLAITPQFFLQRALINRNFDVLNPDVYGLNIAVRSTFSPQTTLGAFIGLRSLDPTTLADTSRAGLRLTHRIDDYRLDVEAAYRERILNGSLGEQTIQNRFGATLTAPTQQIGKTGIQLDYRVAADLFTAGTDRFGGLKNVTLGRLQGSASVEKAFDLWQGTALPPTATGGLKYTPEPIRPYFRVITGATGVFSGYSNGDTQTSLIGRLRFEAQFGHFSRPYLDYTGFFIGYSQGLQIGTSPFLFDRAVDRQTLSFGILQQVYGPVRLGFQTSINLETGEFFNTDIILDYSRRTYGFRLRYNPNLQLGAIEFRINSFNWVSNRDPLKSPEVGVVEAGVSQTNDPF
jgi:Protein of unknown function (DUF3769)